ncbi:MAG: hypothetical protein M1825_004358 [Sarcosagium campestre]|nr:MAG: hypothetical protein M1825_004358 [Sarcosagium campestre]
MGDILEQKAIDMQNKDELLKRIVFTPTEDWPFQFLMQADTTENEIDPALIEALGSAMKQAATVDCYGYNQGVIMDTNETPLYDFTFSNVGSIMEPEWIKPINRNQLSLIAKAKEQILTATKPDDILLFLGNMAAYFYYAFDEKSDRETHLLPFYGAASTEELARNTPLVDEYIKNYLLPILSNQPQNRRVMLISDIDETGTTESFVNVYRQSNTLPLTNLEYLPIGPTFIAPQAVKGTGPPKELANLPVAAYIDAKSTRSMWHPFTFAEIGLLLPRYPLSLWHTPVQQLPNPDESHMQATLSAIESLNADPSEAEAATVPSPAASPAQAPTQMQAAQQTPSAESGYVTDDDEAQTPRPQNGAVPQLNGAAPVQNGATPSQNGVNKDAQPVPQLMAETTAPKQQQKEVDPNTSVWRFHGDGTPLNPPPSFANGNGISSNGNGISSNGNGISSNGNGISSNGNGVRSNGNGVGAGINGVYQEAPYIE